TLNWCGGVVTYYISGMATSCGQANFAINLGGQTCTISLLVTCCPDTITDIDGNVYNVVQIGNQCWTKENLRTTRYNNGSVIPNVTSDDAWINLSSPAWCNYNNSPANDAVYGKLYNWYTVAAGNLCPTGWHVPTDAEWTVLTNFLGGTSVAGGKMKSTTGWNAPNTAATNESGFSVLPGGNRIDDDGSFYVVGTAGLWWSSTESSTTSAWYRNLVYSNGSATRGSDSKPRGFSVRCLRDQPASGRLEETSTIQGINIYPNPTNSNINIVISATSETQTTIRITDLLGRVLLNETEELLSGNNTITYNIGEYAAGVYLVHVGNGNTQQVYKVVKE
ncbi:MAG: FISUMP domain-containing protein, partial [Bacteroidota bacterium]